MAAGTFTLPYEVHWGQAVLPAGAYTISMESVSSPLVVLSARNDDSVVVPMAIAGK